MKKLPLLLIALFLWIIPVFLPHSGIAQTDWREKISPLLLQAAPNNAETPFLILFSTQADTLSAVNRSAIPADAAQQVFHALRSVTASQQQVLHMLASKGIKTQSFYLVNAIAASGDLSLLQELARLPEVAYIASNLPFAVPLEEPTAVSIANAPQSVEWNLNWIHAPALWEQGISGVGITYANADTGIQWDHPALIDHYRGWDGITANHNYNWWDAIHEDISGNGANPCGFNSIAPCDDYGHGTHTVGISVGGDAINQIGVAPGARWIGCRNMEQGVGRPSTYLECLEFFLAPWDLAKSNPNPTLHADVISNSYTCPPSEECSPRVFAPALANLRTAGIFFSASAGNYGPACGSVYYPPATEPFAFTVGGTGTGYDSNTHQINPASSRGPALVEGIPTHKPDLVAPGFSVRSSYPVNSYAIMGGTSMAAPHVAGAVALLWQAYPSLRGDVALTESILRSSAYPLPPESLCPGDIPGGVPNNTYGYGELDLWNAYHYASLALTYRNAFLPMLINLPTFP